MINNKPEYLYVLNTLNGEIAKIVIKEEDDDLSPFQLLEKYTPDIEKASIDECYLDYTKIIYLYGDYYEFAKKIQMEIKETLGFTVNIGIANNIL